MHPYATPAKRSHAAGREQLPSQQIPPASQGTTNRTPRFVFGPSASQDAGPQFSSTPRFRLGEPGSQAQDDIDLSDDGHQSSPTRLAGSPSHDGSRQRPSRSGDDIMDDSDNSTPKQVVKPHERDILSDSEESASQDAYILQRDEDEHELSQLSPTRPEAKRQRRVAPSHTNRMPIARAGVSGFDVISSSPAERPSSPGSLPADNQPPATSQHAAEDGDELLTPRHRRIPSTPFQNLGKTRVELFPSTAKSTAFTPDPHSPSIAYPTEQHDNPHIPSQTTVSAPPASTPRPKPRFILPPTPYTGDADGETREPVVPNPLSPLSLRKRPGRSSASSLKRPDFIPGGMASELRTWLFETGTKQQGPTSTVSGSYHSSQISTQQWVPNSTAARTAKVETENGRQITYREITSVAAFRSSSEQNARNHGGVLVGRPAPFIQVTPQVDGSGNRCLYDNIILFNPPIIRASAEPRTQDTPGYGLRSGSRIGVRRRLAWEIDMKTPLLTDGTERGIGDQDTEGLPDTKWLVGVEWDILEP